MVSMTPDVWKKAGVGVNPSPFPFYTPRPERRRTDPRLGMDWNPNRSDKEKEVNVQVVLRCRPPIDDEQWQDKSRVITTCSERREVTVSQSIAGKQLDRVFTFDKVFGPKAQQRSIYDQAIAPIVNEVLDGFNCTVFAYGQTGTGKTYTMEGGMTSKNGELSAEAGVIPRAVRQIFDILEAQNADYSMKVTFLELYNEEITDLLAPEDSCSNVRLVDEKPKKSVSLMEDGKGCVVVRGLEEEVVYSANDIYNLLERGAAKRRTADTLLNKRSSRSHAVFTITVHIKETAIGDEDLIKCGKLNLVDLAGSENIFRSGARDSRVREVGEINKSLLTLGRVINALVEHSAHVPYRDSKLTRLLRDSLGGKTKTCIIATISPSAYCMEETLSTLDYAYRAKNIKNKPEANLKMSKTMLLKELYIEIDRMKQDVRAAREKNGVYISHERFALEEADKKARNERIEQLEADLNQSTKEVEKYRELYLSEQEQKLDLQADLKDLQTKFDSMEKVMHDLSKNHNQALLQLKQQDSVICKLSSTEISLVHHAKDLSSNLKDASADLTALHSKIDKKSTMEAENHKLVLSFGSYLDQNLKELHKTILGSVSRQHDHIRCLEEHMSAFVACKDDATKNLELKIHRMMDTYASGVKTLKDLASMLQTKAIDDFGQIDTSISAQTTVVENFLESAASEAAEVISNIQNSLSVQRQLLEVSAEQQEEGMKKTMVSTQLFSEATTVFFNELCKHASKVMAEIEDNQSRKHQHMRDFENMFKEQSAKEEKQAIERIAAILSTLTSNRTTMVCDALAHINVIEREANKSLQEDMCHMQHLANDGRKEMNLHLERTEGHFFEDLHLMTQTRSAMEESLDECSKWVDNSRQQREKTHSSIISMNDRGVSDIQSVVKQKIGDNKAVLDQYIAESVSKDRVFDSCASDLSAAIKDSFAVDCDTRKEVDGLASVCLNELQYIQTTHSDCVSHMRSQAQQCITEDYQVDREATPMKRVLTVPSLSSIEAMRTAASTKGLTRINENLSLEGSGKIHHQVAPQDGLSSERAPLADVN